LPTKPDEWTFVYFGTDCYKGLMYKSSRAWMPARRGIRHTAVATFSALLFAAPAALAAPGDLTPAGCFRDLDNTLTGCASAQGLKRGWGVVTSADGRSVYSIGNEDDAIASFDRDPATGALTYRGCMRDVSRIANGCTLVHGLDGPMGITISDDDKSVYVASDLGDSMAVFARDTTSGVLGWSGCVRDADSAAGACTSAQGLDAPRSIALSPDGRSLYLVSANDDAIAEFARDDNANLTYRGCIRDTSNAGSGCTKVAGLDGPRGVAVTSDGADVYVASRDGDAIASFRRAAGGGLTWNGCFKDAELSPGSCKSAQGLEHPHGIAISPDGRSVYFPGEYDDTVTSFQRDAATGLLSYGGCIRDTARTAFGCTSAEGFDGARQVEVSPDGRDVYVTGADDDAIVRLSRNTTSGALAWMGCIRDVERSDAGCAQRAQGLDNVRAVSVTADGRSAYFASEIDDAVIRFGRETLSTDPPPPPPPPPADTTAPTVAWTAPAAGATVSGTVSCAANAGDDTGVARVEFLVDGQALSTDASAPYNCAWNTTTAADGAHTLTAVAYDAAGNSSRADRSVTVANATAPPPPPPEPTPTPVNQAPTVKLTAPVAGSLYNDNILFAADAADDAAVTKVEFYVDGVLRATDTTAAYRVVWQVPRGWKGSHTVYAKAYDAQGLTATSATVTIRYSKGAANYATSRSSTTTSVKRSCSTKKVRHRASLAKKKACAKKKPFRSARRK
jgi:YD repeat-containing protein